MSRPLRICLPDITYHVYSRCRQHMSLMKDNNIKDIVMIVLHRSQQKYNYELIAYTILDNHIHFVIKTLENEASISKIMQYIKSRIAMEYNKKMKISGPFWNERFKDTIIEKADDPVKYLLWLLWYLAFNPVRKKLSASPSEYKYSSIRCYLSENFKPPIIVKLHKIFLDLGESMEERLESFLVYEEAYRKRLSLLF